MFLYVDARENNNFIFSHALALVRCKTSILKKLMCRPYPFFVCLIANIVRVHRHRFPVLVETCEKDDKERNKIRAGAHNGKMSQEIKTPSVVNLHNELGAHDSLSM